MLPQQTAKNIRQLVDYHARLVRIGANQRGNRVQCIEQEMRIDLAGERIQPGLHQEPLLFVQLTLDTGVVPDFERQHDGQKRREINGAGSHRVREPRQRRLEIENTRLKVNSEALTQELGEEDGGQEEGMEQSSSPVAREVQIEKWRKAPD